MGLRDVFRQAAQSAVSALGDVAVSATFTHIESVDFDASAATTSAVTSTGGCKVVIGVFSRVDLDRFDVRPEDKKLLVPGASLPAGVTPTVGDKFTIDGVDWEIVGLRSDGADALYQVQVRRP